MLLKELRAIVPTSQANPILTHIKIEGGKAFAANQSHWAELPWALVEGLEPCCLPYKELAAFLSLVDEADATITMKDDGAYALVQAKRRRATLPVMGVDQFPRHDHIGKDEGNRVTVNAKDLALAIHAVNENDRVLPQLGGVCFRVDQIIATDRQRIVRRPASAPETSVSIPVAFCNLLLGRVEDEIELRVTDHAATWWGPDDAVISTKLIEGKFPEVNRLYPDETNWRVWVREEFEAALDTVDLATGSDAVTITIANGQSRFVSRDTAGKEFVYEGICEGDDIEIIVARRYLRDALDARPDDEEVRLGMNGPTDPIMFGEDELIMPMRS